MEIGLIKPYEKNAKEHTPKQVKLIAESIKRFGGAKVLGLKDVPVIKRDGRIIRVKQR